MLWILLAAYGVVVLVWAGVLAFREDGNAFDVLLMMVGGIFIVMYVAGHYALRSSIVVPLFQLWNLYPIILVFFFLRGFVAPRIAMLRPIYFVGGVMLILPLLFAMGIIAIAGAHGGG